MLDYTDIRNIVGIENVNFEKDGKEIRGIDECNNRSNIKAAFYGANEYPGPVKNWTTVYLTVAAI